MKKFARIAFFIGLVMVVSAPAFSVTLTSVTMEKSTGTGQTVFAPGGIWSTSTGDPYTQLGVMQNGAFLNTPDGVIIGEISANLTPGMNDFWLIGTFNTNYLESDYYGLALYFDNKAIGPQMAVYNANGSSGPFMVIAAGTSIAGSANGGITPDNALGSYKYTAPDGSTVELIAFNVFNDSQYNVVGWGTIYADEYPDKYANLQLKYTPVPIPPSMLLLGSGLLGLVGLRKRFTRR